MKNSQENIGWNLPVVGRYRFGFILGALLLLCAVLSLLASTSASALTTVPTKMNFQGRLTDNTGNIKANGTYNMKLRLYTVNSGGTAVWTEDRLVSAGNGVTVTNGLFSIQLGSVTTLPANLFASGALYLEVELPTPATATTSGTPTWTEGAMTPRNQMATSAYAYNSETLDGLDSAAFGQVGAQNYWLDDQYFNYLEASGGAAFGGVVETYITSPTAFLVRDSAGSVFTVDTTNRAVKVGGSAADATGVVLVLDTKNTAGDPAGATNGSMYYNSSIQEFRCLEGSSWKNCNDGGDAESLDGLESTEFGKLASYNVWSGPNHFNNQLHIQSLSSMAFKISGDGDLLTADTYNHSVTINDFKYTDTPVVSCDSVTNGSGPYQKAIGPGGTATFNCTLSGNVSNAFTYDINWTLDDGAGNTGDLASTLCIGAVCGWQGDSITPTATTNTFTINVTNDPYQGYTATIEDISISRRVTGGGLKVTNGAYTTSFTASSANIAGQASFVSQTANTEAFGIRTFGGTKLFAADTSNTRIQIGNAVADSTGVVLVLDTKTTLSDPTGVAGAMYYNSNLNKFRCYQSSAWRNCYDSTVANLTVPVGNTVANTATETAFTSNYTIPTNSCTPGKVYKVTARGIYSTAATSTSLTTRIYIGSTSVLATNANSVPASVSSKQWVLQADFVCLTSGVTGTIEGQGNMVRNTSSNVIADIAQMVNTAPDTIDTTVSNTLSLRVQWGAASASNTIQMRQFIVEEKNP